MANENEVNPLVQAFADHWEIPTDDIVNYAVIVKRRDDSGITYSSIYPEGVELDDLLGIAGILHAQIAKAV